VDDNQYFYKGENMNKKVFTVLLLAVFVLAQFSMASAATLPGTGSITSIPELSSNAGVNIDWAATGLAGPTQNVLLWGKDSTAVAYMAADCAVISTVAGSGGASGTFTYSFAGVGNGDIWDFTVTVDSMTCGAATVPAVSDVMGSTTIDSVAPYGFVANPPSTEAVPFSSLHASCNTFELWGVASDRIYTDPDPYSGFNSWNFGQTGSFAPLGPDNSVLSQEITFPATANGAWSFTYNPSDMLGNNWGVGPFYFRNAVAVTPAELAGCADFTDVSGHATEVQVRYLADLGLIAGNPDGSFGVNSTLTLALLLVPLSLVRGAELVLGGPVTLLQSWLEPLEPFRLANRYHVFPTIERERIELVIEASSDGVDWQPLDFRYRPDDPAQSPAFIVPHQPRLDWMLWFVPRNPLFLDLFERFLLRLREGSPAVTALLVRPPTGEEPPGWLRVRLYRYHFERPGEITSDGAWWRREDLGPFYPLPLL